MDHDQNLVSYMLQNSHRILRNRILRGIPYDTILNPFLGSLEWISSPDLRQG